MILSGPRVSVISHLLTFAAEYSRLTNKTVIMDEVTPGKANNPHEEMLEKIKKMLATI